MTGMVKEEILIRQGELGFSIENGNVAFDFLLLDRDEFLADPGVFSYWGVNGQQQMDLQAGSMAFTICQVPVILQASNGTCIIMGLTDGSSRRIEGHVLDPIHSRYIFQRDGVVHHLELHLIR